MEESVPEAHIGKPLILALCDDPAGLGRIERELRTRYRADYRVVCESSAEAVLEARQRLDDAGERVAIVLADQRMRGVSGVEVLVRVREICSTAKRLLLTSPMETSIQTALSRAMALGQIDNFEAMPGRPPNEGFH